MFSQLLPWLPKLCDMYSVFAVRSPLNCQIHQRENNSLSRAPLTGSAHSYVVLTTQRRGFAIRCLDQLVGRIAFAGQIGISSGKNESNLICATIVYRVHFVYRVHLITWFALLIKTMAFVVRLLKVILCICFLLEVPAPNPGKPKRKTVLAAAARQTARQTVAANARYSADLLSKLAMTRIHGVSSNTIIKNI